MRFSRLVSISCLTVLLALPAAAQIRVGVLGGMSLARLRYDPDTEISLSGRSGFAFGGVVSVSLGSDSDLHVEPAYVQKGGTLTRATEKSEISLSYLEMPFMLRFFLSESKVKPYLLAGPSFGFLLDAKVKGPDDFGNIVERDMKDEVKTLDFNLGVGLGVDVQMGGGAFFIEGRYAHGSTDINDLPATDNPTVKTRGILILVGYTIALGSR